jgi:hypothetical protein
MSGLEGTRRRSASVVYSERKTWDIGTRWLERGFVARAQRAGPGRATMTLGIPS